MPVPQTQSLPLVLLPWHWHSCRCFPPSEVPSMRCTACILFVLSAGVVVAADDFKLEPGYKLIFNGKNLDGWQTKAAGKDGKPMSLEGKTEAYDGRFKVVDGELVYDPKVKGDRYIETVAR